MGITLLWVSSLASALLLVATIMALAGKLKRFHIRFILPIISALLPLLVGVGITVFAYKWSGPKLPWPFGYTLSWTLVYLSGAVVILVFGLRLREQELAACVWSRSKLAAMFGIVLVLHFCILLMLDNTARTKLAVVRSDALSIALSLQPPRVLDHLNASIVYEEAFEAMGEMKLPYWWNEIGEPAFDLSKSEVKKFLEGKQEALILLQRAASMPEYYVEINYLKGEIPSLLPYTRAASLLALDARFKAKNGEIPTALKNLLAIQGMANHLSTVPSIMPIMVAATIQLTGTQAAENILSGGQTISAGALEKPIYNPVYLQESLNDALRMEEAFMAYTSTSYLAVNPIDHWCLMGELLYRGLLLHDELISARELMLEANTITAKPYWESSDDWKRWDESVNAFHGLITAIMLPSYGRGIKVKVLEAEAERGLTSLAFAASAYLTDNGVYPASTEVLTPQYITQIPADPFSGEPLKLTSVQDGLILYSVGPDLKDDGGIKEYDLKQSSKETKPGDIAFVMGSAFEDRRFEPSREFLEKLAKEREQHPRKRKK